MIQIVPEQRENLNCPTKGLPHQGNSLFLDAAARFLFILLF